VPTGIDWERMLYEWRHQVKKALLAGGEDAPVESFAASRLPFPALDTWSCLTQTPPKRPPGEPLSKHDWPWCLEGAFFWADADGVRTVYRSFNAASATAALYRRERNTHHECA
jgi:hypothetical protein